MKYWVIMIAFGLCLQCFAEVEYDQLIQKHAQEWKNSYIETLANPHHLQTLIDVILLSHLIAQESCFLMITKLIIQEELLKIYTPSLNDSWHTNMQVVNNDTSKIESAIESIKKSQNIFQNIFIQLKNIAPKLVQINPEPTKTLIHDLKHSLMTWGKQQQEITQQLSAIQQEFSLAIATISDIKIMFETMIQAPDFKQSYLKEAAGYVAKTNKDIETVFAHVTQMRKASISKIQEFFHVFFKTYYQTLYNLLTSEQQNTFSTLATENGKIPHPDAFFS